MDIIISFTDLMYYILIQIFTVVTAKIYIYDYLRMQVFYRIYNYRYIRNLHISKVVILGKNSILVFTLF